MTPVDDGRTSPGATPSSRAASAETRSAASTPPGAQTFEIFVFTTIPPSAGASSRRRPTTTGAPGKALRVNFAAKEGVGRSSATSVSFIRPGFGTSTGTNSKLVVPMRKPSGSADCASSQARCSARLAKVSEVDGMLRFRRSAGRRQRARAPGRPPPRTRVARTPEGA